MKRYMLPLLPSAMFLLTFLPARAEIPVEESAPPPVFETQEPKGLRPPAPSGSTAFCLYELPADSQGRRRWLNLGIVQYLEYGRNEIKIYYGGGNLGSGHEARIPAADPAQLDAALDKMRQTAAACR